MYQSVGDEDFAHDIWDEEWTTPNDPDDLYSDLMVDWYFETLGTKLTLDDHRLIKHNAQTYMTVHRRRRRRSIRI
jgi:hypothetical protein